jgi:hypothetical protein
MQGYTGLKGYKGNSKDRKYEDMLDFDSPAMKPISNSFECPDLMLTSTDSYAGESMARDKAATQKNAEQQKNYHQQVKDFYETPVGVKTTGRHIEVSKTTTDQTGQKPNDEFGTIKKGTIDEKAWTTLGRDTVSTILTIGK